ncbi:CBS domain-containing protein [Halodesulfurarchaeum sp. HSR-GB]|uniref:Putative signal transduction protein with CBS domains n=1 Tax=Halodesulfurarchaeum formicicum TaxID=1873524 RepID=A0A1J1A9M6_9EURY|nr:MULTISPECIES: CBS domain-containing protein [Halodesulfurarchaeum]APE94520.1 putative signal transduction protein with CBS domains [Halodesulfurarchaeum formicicum]MDR5656108.1 CBS domain-containing protein [Halodesulfurarchaeum sp. HSR-GB]
MKVADAMTPREDVVTVSLPGTRDDVLEYLQERAFSSVPVVKETDDGEQYRGLVSREALIARPDEDQLAILMEDVPTTESEADIHDVAQVMAETGERRIPVVNGGSLTGMITVTDIIRAIADGDVDGDLEVGDLASYDVNTVFVGTPLVVAEREIAFANVPYAIALDETGEMAGIITEVDLIDVAEVVEGEDATGDSIANQDDDWMWEGIKAVGNRYLPTRDVELPDAPVSEYMSDQLVSVTGTRSAREVAGLLLDNDIEQVPLKRGDELVGVVRDVDLIAGL